ncbi:MAG: FxLYD domain-containing protein, partial [Verrucomicrobia bacterium]|nr:FxLYD domain-containing protein [Verrucomicrobiota bacterium]
ILAVALFMFDWCQRARLERFRIETQQQFVADLTVALKKALPSSESNLLFRDDAAIPSVSLTFHNNPMPRGTGQIEIFNLASSSAYTDASGTRVTGELCNGTPRNFSLVVVALVALDGRGKVTRRQQMLFTGLAAGERRAFETTLNLPLDQFAAHRFELDAAR